MGLLWAQGSGRKDGRAFSDVSATSGPSYADAEFPSPSRFSRSVEINGAGEIMLRSIFQMINDWNYNPLPLYYACPIRTGPRIIYLNNMESFIA